MTTCRTIIALAVPLALALPGAAAAQGLEIGVYLGAQGATDSSVSGNDPTGPGSFSFDTGWDSDSFSAPPYYGLRATWWWTAINGVALELNHTKIAADPSVRAANGFDRLEFTDGLNLLTVNYMHRFPQAGRAWTPYLGAGLGLAIPHVEVETSGSRTYEYQTAGPAVVAIAGIDYRLGDGPWSVFGEAKIGYSSLEADLEGGGRLETDVTTGALNLGLSYRF